MARSLAAPDTGERAAVSKNALQNHEIAGRPSGRHATTGGLPGECLWPRRCAAGRAVLASVQKQIGSHLSLKRNPGEGLLDASGRNVRRSAGDSYRILLAEQALEVVSIVSLNSQS